jgi:hypothetical protein
MGNLDTGIIYRESFFRKLISSECFWVSVMLFVLVAGIAGNSMWSKWCEAEIAKKSMEEGYSQQSLPGQTGVYWVKTSEKAQKPVEAGVQ